jgi:hypothetical protein
MALPALLEPGRTFRPHSHCVVLDRVQRASTYVSDWIGNHAVYRLLAYCLVTCAWIL